MKAQCVIPNKFQSEGFQFFTAFFGNLTLYYTITLYGFFASFLAPIYFPHGDKSIALMGSFGAFAAGFLMRPVGGILFGHIGDRYGRKRALVSSSWFLVPSTFAIAILPGYAEIGFMAPTLLILCRLIQGLCAGGEHTGAIVFVIETLSPQKRYAYSSMLIASGTLGALLGGGVGAIAMACFPETWGWRVPFLVASVMTIVSFFLRQYLIEKPVLKDIKQGAAFVPLFGVFRHYGHNFACIMGIGAFVTTPLYLSTTYFSNALYKQYHLSHTAVFLILSGIMLVGTIGLPLMAKLAVRIGGKNQMLGAALTLLVVAYPLFMRLQQANLVEAVVIQLVIICLNVAFVAPSAVFEVGLFPEFVRYSAMSVGYSTGLAIFGGASPLICTFIVSITGKEENAALYLMLSALLGMAGVWFARLSNANDNLSSLSGNKT